MKSPNAKTYCFFYFPIHRIAITDIGTTAGYTTERKMENMEKKIMKRELKAKKNWKKKDKKNKMHRREKTEVQKVLVREKKRERLRANP